MKAPAFRFERASRRAERVAKRQSASPEPASDVLDPIDEQISSLLESVSSKNEAQAAVVDPDFSPDRVAPDGVAPSQGPPSTPLRKYRDPVDPPEGLRRARAPRPARPSQTVRPAFSRIAIDLPRPHLSYGWRQVCSLTAILLLSVALAFLIVHLMSP
jgi:hypothetical protein